MSYAMSAPLQQAVYAVLSSDTALGEAVGTHIFDAAPSGEIPALYVQLGAETARDASDGSGSGAVHRFGIFVVSNAAGYADAKRVAGLVSDVLHGADLTLSRGRLITMQFERATAKFASSAAQRRIEMRFRARVQDS